MDSRIKKNTSTPALWYQIPRIAKLISYTETKNRMYHTFRSDVPEFGLFKTGGRQNYHELFEG